MIVWIVLTVLITLAAVALVIPLLRPRAAAGQGGATAVGILRDQLAELDAQQASGSVTADEAARLKLEIERRMLAEAREGEAPARPLKDRTLLLLAFGVAGGVALGAAGLYAFMGKPGAPAATQQAQSLASAGTGEHPGGGDIQSQILQLQQQLSANPNDAEGWRLLGWSYFQTGAFNEAAVAYGRAATLDPQNADHVSAQGESLIQAAGGRVTPEAEAAFRAALRINPQDPRARYFLAVLKDQAGDADGAMNDWIELVNSAPPGAPWVGEVRRFVEDLARERGVDVSTRLKPAAATGSALPGPNAEQVAAAQSMAPEDRDAMIRGMVDSLEGKLRANPRDPEGWVRLMRSRMTLGDRTAAATALRNARSGLAGDAAGLAQVNEAARGLGVPGA
ncbi:MAG: c-type cytochrome biogenesis protein CcmI [Brevundimonas sp.]